MGCLATGVSNICVNECPILCARGLALPLACRLFVTVSVTWVCLSTICAHSLVLPRVRPCAHHLYQVCVSVHLFVHLVVHCVCVSSCVCLSTLCVYSSIICVRSPNVLCAIVLFLLFVFSCAFVHFYLRVCSLLSLIHI